MWNVVVGVGVEGGVIYFWEGERQAARFPPVEDKVLGVIKVGGLLLSPS